MSNDTVIALMLLLFIGIPVVVGIIAYCAGRNGVRTELNKLGLAEYYLDENGSKAWRVLLISK